MASESEVYSWEPHPLHPDGTEPLHRIAVDYCPEVCLHERHAGEIHVTYDHRGGARWRSRRRFLPGSAVATTIRTPAGDTSGLNYNIYLSSLEGSKDQDEIDFEFLGHDKRAVQTNYHVGGDGGREQIHALPFDSSDGFHHYAIAWDAAAIEWRVDGELVRREQRREGEPWPEKPMYLYASVWDASHIADGAWTGTYHGRDAPYVCSYKDVRVPTAEHSLEEEPHPLHPDGTEPLQEIAVDYCPEACLEERHVGEIHVTYDARGGARWRSKRRFRPGSAVATTIRAPAGDTSGLNYNIYLSSLEGSKDQDEIDFEFLGHDKRAVQTNYHVNGDGGREQIHVLPFDSSDGFHHYAITWDAARIEWRVDGELVRREERREGEPWPEKPMYLYASVWDASYIADGAWTGTYHGRDAPYVCSYKDVRVPTGKDLVEEEEHQDADAADAPADDPEADAAADAAAAAAEEEKDAGAGEV
ncbi:unnamed protein product [Miscanthus lutarioriparius]|uniref:GH16 domain-containing protein n=1 Tax=Miscanthus lutarioriparius TaxID=422564 RepID=A0A811MAA9_9POAL|nr:unnamed protein product [Miscanthus lutarioriparius]